MDLIFKALADDTRRRLLDILRERDGRSLVELEQAILDSGLEMTRFGIMKHLKVLEGRFAGHQPPQRSVQISLSQCDPAAGNTGPMD